MCAHACVCCVCWRGNFQFCHLPTHPTDSTSPHHPIKPTNKKERNPTLFSQSPPNTYSSPHLYTPCFAPFIHTFHPSPHKQILSATAANKTPLKPQPENANPPNSIISLQSPALPHLIFHSCRYPPLKSRLYLGTQAIALQNTNVLALLLPPTTAKPP